MLKNYFAVEPTKLVQKGELQISVSNSPFPSALFIISTCQINQNISILVPWLNMSSDIIPGGRRSPAVACWASDHWVASSNPLRGKFCH